MIYRFDNFSLDDERFELLRDGEQVAVERRVLDLILYLIRNRDRVVSRAELSRHLWPEVHVDADHGLNQAVYSARQTLGDSSKAPRFIQTVLRRGLRFVASVKEQEFRSPDTTLADPHVGRSLALAVLLDCADARVGGLGPFIMVTGEPGIGKSRLLLEYSAHARHEGTVVLGARPPRGFGAPPFFPWVTILESLGKEPRAVSDRIRRRATHLADSLVGRSAAQGDADEPRRRDLFVEVQSLLRDASDALSAVIVLDDVHDFDPSSKALLSFLVSANALPIPIVASARTHHYHDERQRLETVSLLDSADETIELQRLSESDVDDYLKAIGLKRQPEGLVERLYVKSGGNPFFLKQLCLCVGIENSGALPETVRQLVAERMAPLPHNCKELLQVASAEGRAFEVDVLRRVCGRYPSFELDIAEGAGLVRVGLKPGTYAFAHDLVRECIYEQLSPSQRGAIHHQVFMALNSAATPATVRAHHASLAGRRVPDRQVIALLMEAGNESLRAFAYEGAVEFFTEAVQRCRLAEEDDLQPRLMLGQALLLSGQRDAASQQLVSVCRAAAAQGRWKAAANAALALAPGFFSIEAGVVDPELITTLRVGLNTVGNRLPEVQSLLRSRLAMALYWDPCAKSERRRLVRDSLASLPSSASACAEVVAYRIAAMWSPWNCDNRLRMAKRLIAMAEESGASELALMGDVYLVTSQLERGELGSVRSRLRILNSRLRGNPHLAWYSHIYEGMLAALDGQADAVESSAKQVLRAGSSTGDSNVMNSFAPLLIYQRWQAGRIDEVLHLIPRLAERFPAVPAWRAARAMFLYEAGDRAAAEIDYSQLIREWETWDENITWVLAVMALADLAVDLEDAHGAEALFSALRPLEDRACVVGYGVLYWGSVNRVLGRLSALIGASREAEGRLVSASDLEARAGAGVWRLRCQIDLAEAVMRTGKAARMPQVRSLLFSAEEECSSLGLAAWQQRIRAIRARSNARFGCE